MTLANDYLLRGKTHAHGDIPLAAHKILLQYLCPVGPHNAKSHAEQFIFDHDVPNVMYQIMNSGAVSPDVLFEVARLPSASTWVEWPCSQYPGCKLGILMVDKIVKYPIDARIDDMTGLFFVMRTGKGESDVVSCFGCVGFPFSRQTKQGVGVAFWRDYVAMGEPVPQEILAEIRSFIADAVDALFLIMTPRVCEVRHVEWSGKVNRKREALGKLPLVEYKNMILKVGVGAPRYVSHGAPIPVVKGAEPAYHKRLHRVIGHFRTYRARREVPRVSFVPEHWRGDAELGVVLKTRHVLTEEKSHGEE